MENFETVILTKKESIATITLNRPNSANSINPTLARELAAAALSCDKDDSIRCVILNANGKMFCAGGDLKSVGGAPQKAAEKIKGTADNLHRGISSLARMNKPFIVAVNKIELYNLRTDIREQDNLVEKMPEKAVKLKNKLAVWQERIGALFPKENPDY